jgi:hypothetical protein
MPYILRVDAVMQKTWDSLPNAASLALTDALTRVCDDPLGTTDPYGEDDGIMRMLIVSGVLFAVIYIGHQTRTVHLFQIDYVG